VKSVVIGFYYFPRFSLSPSLHFFVSSVKSVSSVVLGVFRIRFFGDVFYSAGPGSPAGQPVRAFGRVA